MTPEDTVRDGLDAYWEAPSEYHSALDALVAERDRLAAQLAAAERERDEALHAEDVAERYREAAEARVAALTTASGRVRSADRSRGISVLTQEAEIALAALYDVLNDEALAAADRPEGTTREGNA